MKKFFGILAGAVLFMELQSCSISTETTYYKDSATSMKSDILMDQSMMGMMNMMSDGSNASQNISQINNLSTDWKSLYDIQKQGKVVLNPDSSKVLKKMFMKLNKSNGEILGLSLKYDKLLPKELTSLFSQNKTLGKVPLQNFANWDGKTLTIDTEKFNATDFLQQISQMSDENAKDKTTPKSKTDSIKAYGKQMAESVVGMLKLVNLNFSNTLKFQKPIKSIVGKHDFVKQIDDKTIQITVNTHEMMDKNKKLTNQDKKIVITTE